MRCTGVSGVKRNRSVAELNGYRTPSTTATPMASRPETLSAETRSTIFARSISVAASSDSRLRARSPASAGLTADQSFSRTVRVHDLSEVLGAEQRHLQGAVVAGQRHDRRGLQRRARRNMLREDETFAAKLALAGVPGHVADSLAHRR